MLAVAGLNGCTKISSQTGVTSGNSWTVHGILRVGSYEDLDSLNPILSNEAFVSDVCQMIYSGLIDYDDHADPIPDAALAVPSLSNGGISKDGKTIVYRLRRGITFSDGVPLTSADVKFTWQQIMNPANNLPYRYPYDQVRSIDTPDPQTVVVHLRAPFAPFVSYFMRDGNVGAILPEHLLAGNADLNRVAFNTHPVGSGPFIVKQWVPGSLLELAANPRYWRGAPKLRRIEYRIIPSQNTLLTALRSHELDFYYSAPEVQYATLKRLGGFRITVTPNMTFEHVTFNAGRPPFDDVRVRRALAFAIDWKKLADDVYLGLDVPGMADESPMSWAFNKDVRPYPYDVAAANALLAAAGWRRDQSGMLRKNGQPFEITMVTVSGVTTRENAEVLIQRYLHDIGINVLIRNYPASLLFATYGAGGVLQHGKFDLALFGWQYTVPDPDDTQTIGPDQVPPAGQNVTFYADPDIGNWQNGGRLHYDRAGRRPYYLKIQQRIHDAVPEYTIVWRSTIDAVNSDLQNFRPAPAVSDFWNSYDWSI